MTGTGAIASALFLATAVPERIVSIDHCADLHVLAMVERGRIAAVSAHASSDYAFLAEEAKGLPTARPEAESVLAHRPTHVVRSYGGDARLLRLLRRAGVEVIEIGFPATPEAIRSNTERVAKALGGTTPSLEAARSNPERGSALYLTPSGVVSGSGTLTSQLLEAAGYSPFEKRPGWHPLPLERLVVKSPDLLVTSFFRSSARFEGWWDASRHPLASELLRDIPSVSVPPSYVACAAYPALRVPALVGGEP